MDECSNPDLGTTPLFCAVKSGDIGLNAMEEKEYLEEGTEGVKELERSGWPVGAESNFQPFEQHDFDSIIAAPKKFPDLQDYTHDGQGKNYFDTSSAPVSERPKFVIPKVPDFSKLLERCT